MSPTNSDNAPSGAKRFRAYCRGMSNYSVVVYAADENEALRLAEKKSEWDWRLDATEVDITSIEFACEEEIEDTGSPMTDKDLRDIALDQLSILHECNSASMSDDDLARYLELVKQIGRLLDLDVDDVQLAL